jgi:hypothetical protein
MEKTEEIIENGKSRDTGNILQKTYTQHNTEKKDNQHKTRDEPRCSRR